MYIHSTSPNAHQHGFNNICTQCVVYQTPSLLLIVDVAKINNFTRMLLITDIMLYRYTPCLVNYLQYTSTHHLTHDTHYTRVSITLKLL